MLQAIPLIRARHPEVEFECFGRFHDDVDFPGGLTRHGYLSDAEVVALYRRCMIFVLPSHAEGWGLPAAEAMANGAAVVVTENGGSSDFAIDGETALVVPPHDPAAITDAVSTLILDEARRAQLVEAGINICNEMTWDRAIEKLLTLLPGDKATSAT